jgi:hypothetical protein
VDRRSIGAIIAPALPTIGYVWDRCIGTYTFPTAATTSANFETASRMATMGEFDDASGKEIFEKAFAVWKGH